MVDSAGHTRNQQLLAEHRQRFARSTRRGHEVLEFFRQNECEIFRYESDVQSRWWLNVVLPARISEMFDTHLEVLCMYTEYETVEPRTLGVLQQRLRRDARTDPEFAILFSRDSNLGRLAERRRGEFAMLALNLDDFANDGRDLRSHMTEVLTALDHYDFTFPVREPSGFFGRRQELDNLQFALGRGQPVGLFGLRKAGKTSLLNFVQLQRQEAGRPVVRLDMSEVSSADEFRLELLKRTAARVVEAGKRLPKLRMLTRELALKVEGEALRLGWLDELGGLLSALPSPLELIIDEIDQAYPDRSSLDKGEAQGLFVALTQLRGLIQRRDSEQQNGLVILCAGVDPAIFERPLIDRRDNLLYKMVRLEFLAPMERDEMAEMVRGLGKRMALRYRDKGAIDFLFDEYGGHPLLTRKACSSATDKRPKNEVPWDVPVGALETAAALRGRKTPAEQAADVLDSFREWFPEEAELLRLLWSEDESDTRMAREMLDDDALSGEHIKAYGLAHDDWSPRIRALRSFALK